MVIVLLHISKWLWIRLATLIMLMAVLLPIYGPWIDPFFAELMPEHDHIFIGEVNLDHHHPLTQTHEHAHPKEQPAQPEQPTPFATGVVSLPNLDAILQELMVLLICSNQLLALQRTDTIIFPMVIATLTVYGVSVLPLDNPPRF